MTSSKRASAVEGDEPEPRDLAEARLEEVSHRSDESTGSPARGEAELEPAHERKRGIDTMTGVWAREPS
jgi:hypothetical protein